MIIYIDIYFLKNFIFNFLLLYITSFVTRKKASFWRLIIASILGSLYAVAALYIEGIFYSAIFKWIVATLMLFISFGKKEILASISSFLFLSYLAAGIISSLLDVPEQYILILFAASTIVLFWYYKQMQKQNNYYEIKINFLEYEIQLNMKLDTGNELKDSIFGDSVIVVSEEKMKNILENDLMKVLKNEKLQIPEKYQKRIRLISFKTISGEGIKIGIKLDKVIIYMNDKRFETKAIMILSERNFKNYDGLIGNNLLEGGWEHESNCTNKIKDERVV